MEWALLPFSRMTDFAGRSRRKEYWSFTALAFAGLVVAGTAEALVGLGGLLFGFGPLTLLLALALLPAGLAVTVRRLHDTGKTGWFAAIGLVPYVGGIVLLVLCALDGDSAPNEYGADPAAADRTLLSA